jgi:hypothetical protein
MKIQTDGPWFKDELGRTLILRGINLGGSSKVPANPDGATHLQPHFFDHRNPSFVGRPFPLSQADEHFSRLKHWGFRFLRFLVTWEAVEHAGPGQYDHAYLRYLRAIVEAAARHDINLFIDPHQDVWSRFSGGDGAPGWTFEAVGLDIQRFQDTGAAIVHQTQGDPFPRMIWPTNSGKLAAATMFTLFFGGDDFAAETRIHGEPAQEFLQRHYIDSMVQVAIALQGMPNVIGFDTMNEPLQGFIGQQDLHKPIGLMRLGPCPSPVQAMFLGSGFPQSVDFWHLDLRGNRVVRKHNIDPGGLGCWLTGFDCIWRQNGVWDLDYDHRPYLARTDHFSQVNGKPVDFVRDYFNPFARRFAHAIHSILPEALIFLESDPRQNQLEWDLQDASKMVYAPHWYDGYALVMKDFKSFLAINLHTGKIVLGSGRIRRSFAEQLDRLRQNARTNMGNIPTLIGEFGIPFDMGDRRAFRSGNFKPQIAALDRSMRAMEDTILSCTLWNYTADNDNQRGDQCNGEDLSIFSRDQQADPTQIDSGGRALEAAVRPYPIAVAGEPVLLAFDIKRKFFSFEFNHDPELSAPTEIFVPTLQYPNGFKVNLSDGSYTSGKEQQILQYFHSQGQRHHQIQIHP